MEIPKSVAERLKEKGYDLTRIVEIILKFLNIDPDTSSKVHKELAIAMFNEGVKLSEKGDVVQSSEKLYKAIEESIKALAIAKGLDEVKEAENKGRWTTSLLDKAALKLGEEISRAWEAAFFLHINGFHEATITVDEVTSRIPLIKKVIDSLNF